MYCWTQRLGISDTIVHSQIITQTVCNRKEVLGKLSVLYYLRECMTQIVGSGKIVKVDKTHIFPFKYYIGSTLFSMTVWVVGAIFRTGKNYCLRIVRKRNK
jgi:hypothetical protein